MKAAFACKALGILACLLLAFASLAVDGPAGEDEEEGDVRVIRISDAEDEEEEDPVAPETSGEPDASVELAPQGVAAAGSGSDSPREAPPDRESAPDAHSSGTRIPREPPRRVAERLVERKLGTEGFRRWLDRLEEGQRRGTAGLGSLSADQWFDNAAPRPPGEDAARPQGTRFFTAYQPLSASQADDAVRTYGGMPGGGVVLEGKASGIPPARSIAVDRKLNALIIDRRVVYFLAVPGEAVAQLCRALARDNRLGVSLGQVHLVYGALPGDSGIAIDLKLADRFLADIVFAMGDWTRGYRFAGDYAPEATPKHAKPLLVFFRFGEIRFEVRDDELQLAGASVGVSIVPLSNRAAADGNLLPDFDALRADDLPAEPRRNAEHLASHMDHYRQEHIVQRAYAYAETAALLRRLQAKGADLEDLAGKLSGR